MTVDEKVGQMTQMTVTNFEEKGKPGVFDMVKLKDAIHNYHIGSMLNNREHQQYKDGKK
jgi:beta-glucosidase